MSVFTILTDDESLIARVRLGLARSDIVHHIRGGLDALVPRPEAGRADIIALDLCDMDEAHAVVRLIEFCRRVGDDRRVVGIVSTLDRPHVRAITSKSGRDIAVILNDAEQVGMALRAIGNDRSLTVCAAVTLEVLECLQKPVAQSIAGVVLGSACQIHNVLDVTGEIGSSKSRLGELLANEGSRTASGVIHRAQCVYALALARHTSMPILGIAAMTRLGKPERFHEYCEKELGGRVKRLARQWPVLSLDAFLERALKDATAMTPRPKKHAGSEVRRKNQGEGRFRLSGNPPRGVRGTNVT